MSKFVEFLCKESKTETLVLDVGVLVRSQREKPQLIWDVYKMSVLHTFIYNTPHTLGSLPETSAMLVLVTNGKK